LLEYEVKELSEKELESRIRDHPHQIEPGLNFVDAQRRAGRGPLDLLFHDSGKALVVVELKVAKSDGMLFQAIDYFDYVYSNRERLALAYKAKGIDIDASQEPRIILVSPDFSHLLVNRCKWLKVKVDLYRFRCLIVKRDENIVGELIDFVPVEIPKILGPEEVWTRDKIIGYITSMEMRKTAEEFINEVESWEDVRADPIKGAFSIKTGPNVFAYFSPLRSGFNIAGYLSEHEWQSLVSLNSPDDLPEAISKAREAYENIKSYFQP